MKKFLKATAMLLALAAMFTVAGCKTNADDNGLPGHWSSVTAYQTPTDTRVAGSGPNYTYTSSYAKAEDCFKDDAKAGTGDFYYSNFVLTSYDDEFTGFKATASSTPVRSPYGFNFNMTYNETTEKWKYYTLIIIDDAFKVNLSEGKESKTIIDWKEDDAIKPAAQGNTITVYTEKDSSIAIMINNKIVGVIRNPEVKSGYCGIIGAITYEEYTTQVPTVSKYKFIEFQY